MRKEYLQSTCLIASRTGGQSSQALTHRVALIEYSARTAHLASWSPFVITELKEGEAFLDVVSFPVALDQLVVAQYSKEYQKVTDRLDRIETDLETVKEILLSTARHAAATDKRAEDTNKQVEDIARLVQEQSRLADERGQKIDQRIEDLAQSLQEQNRLADERGQKIDQRIEDLAQSLQEQNRLADERGQKIDQRFEQLREDIDIAFQTISLLSENTDRSMAEFRAEMRDSRTETRAIWDYLMRKSQNGNGDGNV